LHQIYRFQLTEKKIQIKLYWLHYAVSMAVMIISKTRNY